MLTKKDVLWHWGPLQRRAFEGLKSNLCIAPLLIYPDPSLPYTVVSDASGDAVGGVLTQDQVPQLQIDLTEHPGATQTVKHLLQ